jgi:hypothetical protein
VVDPAGKHLSYYGADAAVTEHKAAAQLIHRWQRQQAGLHGALGVEVDEELLSGDFVRVFAERVISWPRSCSRTSTISVEVTRR